MNTCYMCEQQATSKEHVPPQCLFPEAKDVETGENYRYNLMTVPSCEIHNSKKSGHDEFLMYVLVAELMANEVATTPMLNKIKRAVERNPSLANRIFSGAKEVTLESKDGPISSLEVSLDLEMLNESLDHIARGLFYFQTKQPWMKKIVVIPDFVYWLEGENAGVGQAENPELGILVKKLLVSQDSQGENPTVFSYKFTKCEEIPFHAIAQAEFYENSVITILYLDDSAAKC